MSKGGFVYILTNNYKSVFYVGVCSELMYRIIDHIEKRNPGSFTARYNINKLVYFEFLNDIESAIEREKQLKKLSRKKKEQLIHSKNPEWKDLYMDIKNW